MTVTEILAKVANGDLSADEAATLIAANGRSNGKLCCKIGRKGAISVYGLQRMPITLYAEQWERFLEGCPDHFVLAFIREWEGKDYHGESATAQGGKKEKYTATITRKAA